jgi:hypothetical protein
VAAHLCRAKNINRDTGGQETVTDSTAIVPYESQLLSQAAAVGIDLKAMLELIPEADDDAYVRLIQQIATATDVAELDAPWSMTGLTEYVDQWIVVQGLKRMPSDFADGLGFYLVIDAVPAKGGAPFSVSTGSVNVTVQLVRANALQLLPLTCCPRLSKKPTKDGYWPMHLEMHK